MWCVEELDAPTVREKVPNCVHGWGLFRMRERNGNGTACDLSTKPSDWESGKFKSLRGCGVRFSKIVFSRPPGNLKVCGDAEVLQQKFDKAACPCYYTDMQTFLPYPDFAASAAVLDYRRLGKQRVETYQLIRAINGETRGWVNHPAAVMWRRYLPALHMYGRAMCEEWIRRGYKDTMLDRFEVHQNFEYPYWFAFRQFHQSHQSNLIRKDPEFYGEKFIGVPSNLEYVWFPEADPRLTSVSV